MKSFAAVLLLTLLSGCVSSQLSKTSIVDLDNAVTIARAPGLENPSLERCLSLLRTGLQQLPQTGGIATMIAEKEMFSRINATDDCVIVKARINAFFAKVGIVVPIVP